MDTGTFVDMGILVEYPNDLTNLCLEHTTSCDNWDITDLMIVYAFNMYSTMW